MGLRHLLAGVPGSPYFVAQRDIWVIFRTRVTRAAPLRTAVGTPAMTGGSVVRCTAWETTSSRGHNYLSDWFCVTKSSTSTEPKKFCLTALSSPAAARPCWSVTTTRFHSTSSVVAKDVILFEHDRTRFFRLLSFFCAGQLLFWTYLAHFAFTNLRDTRRGQARENTANSGGLFGIDANFGSVMWRYGFTIACLAIGGAIVGFGVLFSRRSVSRVILHRGGGKVTVTTQSPLGAGRAQSLTVPLAQVACFSHRLESPTFIPLRVKGHRFYFLLDREGTLNNHKLFDVTVGAYRPF